MDMQSAEVGSTRAFRLGDFLRDQLRNIAPFITLIALVGFFSIASPSFATLGNLVNILQQVSVTAIMAVGLTFVILTAEIDLSVGAIANATAIVLTFFTLQPDYVNIANLPMPGAIAIILALAGVFRAWPAHRLRRDPHRHSVLHHDAGDDADRRWHLRGSGARPDRLHRSAAHSDARIQVDFRRALDHHRRGDLSARRPSRADLHALRPLRLHGRGKS